MTDYRIEIINERTVMTMTEVCSSCQVSVQFVEELVEEGIVSPDSEGAEWAFDGIALNRILVAARLSRDLRVNTPGIALALELLQRLEKIR